MNHVTFPKLNVAAVSHSPHIDVAQVNPISEVRMAVSLWAKSSKKIGVLGIKLKLIISRLNLNQGTFSKLSKKD